MSTPNEDALMLAGFLEAASLQIGDNEQVNAAAHIRRLVAENENLRTVMVAAAEEIAEHWDAHCDAEGYGPVNLMHCLEKGIPAQYGYTSGAFAKLKAKNEAKAALLRQVVEVLAPVAAIDLRRQGVHHNFASDVLRARAVLAAIHQHLGGKA